MRALHSDGKAEGKSQNHRAVRLGGPFENFVRRESELGGGRRETTVLEWESTRGMLLGG